MEKELKKLFRKEKGITLVALIITIIIMLILAGVAISAVIDGDGLFGKTKNVAGLYEKSSDNENKQISNLMNVIDKYLYKSPDTLQPKDFSLLAVAEERIITVSGNTTDAEKTENSENSGIAGYQYKLNDGEWTEITKKSSWQFEDLVEEVEYTVSMRAIDNAGNITEATNNNISVETKPLIVPNIADGSYDSNVGANIPDTTKLPIGTTKYVSYTGTETYEEQLSTNIPSTWYNYRNGKWANIKTTSSDASLVAYWVWVPRFAYKLPESEEAKSIEIQYIQGNGTLGVNGETCYYATDTEITKNGTGLYNDIQEGAINKWVVHPAFTFGKDNNGNDVQLNGIWVAKYEASSTVPTSTHGGGNTTGYKVQIKPDVISWKGIQLANAFTVCEDISKVGGALGIINETADIDTHLTKNIEWGAVAILSQSKYGVFNPNSLNKGKIWTNSNNSFKTGYVGTAVEAASESNTFLYNTVNGPKASTTGTVYGIYDMAGGSLEFVMGLMASSNNNTLPAVGYTSSLNTGFTGNLYNGTGYTGIRNLPDSKYYDLYAYNNSNLDYTRGKIGDATVELKPKNGIAWNEDNAYFVHEGKVVCLRGGTNNTGTGSGIFCFGHWYGSIAIDESFRAVLVTY